MEKLAQIFECKHFFLPFPEKILMEQFFNYTLYGNNINNRENTGFLRLATTEIISNLPVAVVALYMM